MASLVGRLSRAFFVKNTLTLSRNANQKSVNVTGPTLSRTAVSSTTGRVLPKPDKVPFGLTRMAIVVVPFLYVGTLISKNFAALLEEHEIFVPDDDDDDD
ncbi:single-pass membrane protein with aspartate-rich tail 1b [Danio aesculapii]|uniref:single-pass membrane protein with aspartate-rich tail 1b n=1 Tax=Danio aesculapii TaxID=1142201 RepID=UPI0024BF421B|nr:single-pass membrane protein with aspartate-rich tail 1b [Danio aesculapii]XP_056312411.1 single-pass membrane protein with aspartate-rich tail 1b [Danio aesculapii]